MSDENSDDQNYLNHSNNSSDNEDDENNNLDNINIFNDDINFLFDDRNELHKYYLNFNNFKKRKRKYIELDINPNSISDLIEITNKYIYIEGCDYNFNLKGLNNIKDDLIELNSLIGLVKLKKSIFEQLLYFLQDLHLVQGKDNKNGDFKHTVIYGPPGTGKTEIAQILGKIYSKIGILKKNYFKKVTRSDLIAGYLGQTAIKTKKVIDECLGGVLFIDEAYALGSEGTDIYSKECIDTLCHELSEHKNDLMVIIAGYQKDMDELFFSRNKGLDSRFIWRFEIDNYTSAELFNILKKKINDINWEFAKDTNIKEDWFKNKMSYFTNYGRDMETLLLKVKIVHSKRVFGKLDLLKKINLDDLNKGFELFKDNVEVQKRVDKFKDIPFGLYV